MFKIYMGGKVGSVFTKNFLNNKMVGGYVFASPDSNPMEALESARKTRDAIDQGKPMVMDSEGTLRAKDDKNSLNKTNISEVKGGNEFASQWYVNNKELYEFEHNEMIRCFPNAEMSMLSDDRLCWDVTFPGIIDLEGNKHSWSFKFIYDSDHPHDKGWGGSIKVYPIKPSYDELVVMANRAGKEGVPHIFPDSYGNKCICTAPPKQVKTKAKSNKDITIITVAGWTASWATHFMQGLSDVRVWEKFRKPHTS